MADETAIQIGARALLDAKDAKIAELQKRIKWLEARHKQQTAKVNSYVAENAKLASSVLKSLRDDTAD